VQLDGRQRERDKPGIGFGQEREAVHNSGQPPQFIQSAGGAFALGRTEDLIVQFAFRLPAKDSQWGLELVGDVQSELADARTLPDRAPNRNCNSGAHSSP
jgi:hypothetical protein